MNSWLPWILPVVILLTVGVVMIWQVEDWSRDLTQNHARTDAAAADARLHPIESPLPPGELAAAVRSAAATLPRWQFVDERHQGNTLELHFVRTTPLFRFRDDVRVRIATTAAGQRVEAESQSRVGKGDLGQNPRNLRELFEALRQQLSASAAGE